MPGYVCPNTLYSSNGGLGLHPSTCTGTVQSAVLLPREDRELGPSSSGMGGTGPQCCKTHTGSHGDWRNSRCMMSSCIVCTLIMDLDLAGSEWISWTEDKGIQLV